MRRLQLHSRARRAGNAGVNAFTLIELILVMAMLSIVLAVSAPALSRFFHGRGVDAEARRFLGLTRYAQSRAVAEGVPMVLWIDSQVGAYGMEAETSEVLRDPKAVEFPLGKDLQVELPVPVFGLQAVEWKRTTQIAGRRRSIRFTPDGFLDETVPEWIVFRDLENDEVWLAPSRSQLNYEIATNSLSLARVRR